MKSSNHCVLKASLTVLAICIAMAPAARAQGSWSAPVPFQIPSGCPGISALNAAGQMVGVESVPTANPVTNPIVVCTSDDGVHWSGPTQLGVGNQTQVVLAPDGRAVLVFEQEVLNPNLATSNLHFSVRPPGGTFSTPEIFNNEGGQFSLGMDKEGNVRAAWAPATFNVETASLPAGDRKFGPTTVLCSTRTCRDVHTTVSANGGAYVTWDNNAVVFAASGSVLGNLAAPVGAASNGRICPALPGCFIPHGTLTDSGQGALVWSHRNIQGCNIRNPDGSWPLQFFPTNPVGTSNNCAIDSAGNAIAIFQLAQSTGSQAVMFVRPAGGNFGAPIALPELDTAHGFTLISDSAGTIILVWGDASGNVMARQNLPGGGLGPSTIVGAGSLGLATIVPDPTTGGGLALVGVTGGISHMQVP